MAPLSTDTDASALQLHLKDPESSLSRPRTISDSPPLSPQGILSHTFSQDPTNPTIAGVSGVSKGYVIVGFQLLTLRCSLPTRRRIILLVGWRCRVIMEVRQTRRR